MTHSQEPGAGLLAHLPQGLPAYLSQRQQLLSLQDMTAQRGGHGMVALGAGCMGMWPTQSQRTLCSKGPHIWFKAPLLLDFFFYKVPCKL